MVLGPHKPVDLSGAPLFSKLIGREVAKWSEEKTAAYLRSVGIDPDTLLDDFQDRVQRIVAFDEKLTDEQRDNLTAVIWDIEQYQTDKGRR